MYGKTTSASTPAPKKSQMGANRRPVASAPAQKGPGSKDKCRSLMVEDNTGTAKDHAKGGA